MYIIIGQGAAGTSAAKALRQMDSETPITIITSEPDYFYSRIDLPDIIAGKYQPEDSALSGPEQFREWKMDCRMNEKVVRILPAEKAVELSSGDKLHYDKLLLATGSEPFVPPLPGKEAGGVYTLWTMDQARQIVAAAQTARTAVVVGAGLIGLKTALALKKRGLEVAVVERMPRIMPQQLDETGAGILAEKIRGLGIQVITGTQVSALETDSGKVSGVLLDNRKMPADLVIMAVGVRANVTLARDAGLTVQRGIVTNEFLETSVPGIYAAGDAAEITDLLSGRPAVPAIWPVAVEQGQIAARNMAGEPCAYDGATGMNSVEIAGIPLISVGHLEAGAGDQTFTVQNGEIYRKIVVRGKTVGGVLFMGNIRQAGVAANLVLRQAEIEDTDLLSPGFSFADVMAI